MPRKKDPADFQKLEINFGKKQVEALYEYRKKTGCPVGETVRRAVDQYLNLTIMEIKHESTTSIQ